MEKRITTLLFLMLSTIGVCQEQIATYKYVGFEMYLLKKLEWNKNSFMTNKESREKFGEFLYPETLNQLPDSICHSYIFPNKMELNAEALLTASNNYKRTEIQTELKLEFAKCGKDPRNTPDFILALTEYRE
jgi:hypothetical protein